MPKELRTEVGEVHQEFWKKTVKEAFKNDPLRIIIELIKNAADSYTRLEKKGKLKPPFEIFVKVFCRRNSTPSIEICDNAEGMDSEKLIEALKYGTQTSMGEDIEAVTSAEKGIGLKDGLMALKDNWLTTIKNGLINERKIHPNFNIGFGKEDEKVKEKEREELGIQSNGTVIKGILPEYFRDRKFVTICERLQQHFMMHKLLQSSEYKIYVIDGWSNEKSLLKYKYPEIDKQILKENFKINYNGKDYLIYLVLNKSKIGLTQGKPYGESGLLFFYGKYSVVDFTFCRFDRDVSFSKFFGEVKMEIEKLIRDLDEVLVDEKRRGLDPEHPFNKKLFDEINKRLKKIQEEEETSKYSLDDVAKKEILKEINKIYKDIKGRGTPPQPPIKPEMFEFYPVYTSVKEYEPKNVHLVINSSIIFDELEINFQSSKQKIEVKPSSIKLKKEKVKEEFIIKQVELYSEEPNITGEIVALSKNSDHSTKVGIEVLENPIFSPVDGFAFIPDKITIVDGGQKKIDLCITKELISASKEIKLNPKDPINCPGKLMLPDTKNLEKKLLKNVLIEEIPIKVKGTDNIGKKATITALYDNKVSNLDVTVVPDPSFGGLFTDIRPSSKDTKKISAFIDDEGVLEIYLKHPLIRKYMQGNFRSKPDFLVFIADTITREVIRAFVESGVEENLSKFHIFDIDHPEPDIERYVTNEYYEHGQKMHELFTKLAKTFKTGE